MVLEACASILSPNLESKVSALRANWAIWQPSADRYFCLGSMHCIGEMQAKVGCCQQQSFFVHHNLCDTTCDTAICVNRPAPVLSEFNSYAC